MALVLALGGWIASTAQADPITQPISYYTTGTIGDAAGPITFTGIGSADSSKFMVPGTLNLGQFFVPGLPTTGTLTYTNTSFTIDAYIAEQPGTTGGPYVDVQFSGVLNGTITGNSVSDLLATVTSIQQVGGGTLPFPLAALLVDKQLLMPGGSSTALVARALDLGAEQIPEPTSFALFGTVLVGAGLARWRRARS
jgi:hypothetical protein